ncbi:MAG: hypothetical protein ACRC2B_14285 [Rubrivivax sp.]
MNYSELAVHEYPSWRICQRQQWVAIAVVQYGHFAHLVRAFAPLACVSATVHEVNELRLPGLVRRSKQERCFEGVAGLAKAVELVHVCSLTGGRAGQAG